jgi:hypothetical protein
MKGRLLALGGPIRSSVARHEIDPLPQGKPVNDGFSNGDFSNDGVDIPDFQHDHDSRQ